MVTSTNDMTIYEKLSIRTTDGWNGLAVKRDSGYEVIWSDGTEAFYSHAMAERYIETGGWIVTKRWEVCGNG